MRLRVSGNFSIAAVMILLDWFYFLVSKTPNDSCMFFRISVGEIVSTTIYLRAILSRILQETTFNFQLDRHNYQTRKLEETTDHYSDKLSLKQ